MSIQISQQKNSSNLHKLKFMGIIGLCASCLILAFAAVLLYEPDEVSRAVNCLSLIRVTPAWPQVGVIAPP